MPLWIVERGEAVSFIIVAAVLILGTRLVARAVRAPSGSVSDQYWWGGLIFLVVGRIAHVAALSPELLLDVAVLIRFTDGIDPLLGALATLTFVTWRAYRASEGGALLVASIAGLVLAAAAYALACPVREACYGVTAPTPLGFPMHGLSEPRVATPVLEGATLLLVLAAALHLLGRWQPGTVGWALLAGAVATRLLFLPLSADGIDTRDAGLLGAALAASVAALAVAVMAAGRNRDPHPRPEEVGASDGE